MYIYSFVLPNTVSRGIVNPDKRNKIENVILQFTGKNPLITAPSFADKWVQDLAATFPEKYVVGEKKEDVLAEVKRIDDLKKKEAAEAARKAKLLKESAKTDSDELLVKVNDLEEELEKANDEKNTLLQAAQKAEAEKKALLEKLEKLEAKKSPEKGK